MQASLSAKDQDKAKPGDTVPRPRPEFQLGFTAFPVAARSRGENVTRLIGRFQVLRWLKHPHLCRYLDLLVGREHLIFLVTEHSSRTLADDLAQHAAAGMGALGKAVAVKLARQVGAGLCHLNSMSLVHAHLDPELIVIGEDSTFKLTGHGLCHLTRYGRLTDFPLRPRGQYLPPELVLDSDGPVEKSAAAAPCNKPDVWSLGVILLEVLAGVWAADAGVAAAEANVKVADIEAAQAAVIWYTAYALRTFIRTAEEHQRGLSTTALLGSVWMEDSAAHQQARVPRRFIDGPRSLASGVSLQQLEDSYRSWLSGGVACHGSEDIYELCMACLTAHPQARPTPGDLSSHPALAECLLNDEELAQNRKAKPPTPLLRWVSSTGLRCERVTGGLGSGGLANPAAALGHDLTANLQDLPPMQLLQAFGMEAEQVFYWWSLAGGDVFSTLVEEGLLRPVPPILQVPLCVRDTGVEDHSATAFLDVCQSNSEAGATKLQARDEAAIQSLQRPWQGTSSTRTSDPHQPEAASWSSPWGPPGFVPPRGVGKALQSLCRAVAAADKLPDKEAKILRPKWVYARQHHFAYQWLRVRLFRRLLLKLPESRGTLCQEATEDMPPLLRAQLWAAVVGAEWHLDSGSWLPFYEALLASPLESSSDGDRDDKRVQEQAIQHEGLSNSEGRRRLDRLVHAVLKANPSTCRSDGLGVLAAPISVLYAENELMGFIVLQRILSRFLWIFYCSGGALHRSHCMHLFSALLRFVDPQLEMHMQLIGMEPDIYAASWFPTWFGQLFPYDQVLLLWDAFLLRLPQYPLFVGVCLLHFFRQTILGTDDVSQALNFLASVAQLVDVGVLIQASLALFQAIPASVTLPLYPRHSAGDATVSGPGSCASAGFASSTLQTDETTLKGDGLHTVDHAYQEESKKLAHRAMEQWQRCEWWWQSSASQQTPPVVTVDDLLSFRNRCFVLDVRSQEEYNEGHFQGSTHVPDPSGCGDLKAILPAEILGLGGTPGFDEEEHVDMVDQEASPERKGVVVKAAPPWLFAFDPSRGEPPNLRVRLVVVIGTEPDFGVSFAARLIQAAVRHVVVLLGGAARLKEDAPSYVTRE